MSAPASPRSGDPRARAARTKRDRTRSALLAAAEAAFTTRGWAGTRMEDIAAAAGVSAATAYNHFPTKHTLVAAVYAPLARTVLARADRDISEHRPVVDALADQVRELARLSGRHRELTAAFTAAVQDYTIRVGRLPDPADVGDPRTIVPLPDALRGLIERGQAGGELRGYPPAVEMSGLIVNVLLVRSINRVDESPEVTAELMLTLLFGALRPEIVVAADPARGPFTG